MEYEYNVDGLETIFKVPPIGFNPLSASTDQLASYGFPPRPTTPNELALWMKMGSNFHSITPPAFLAEAHTSASSSQNWSGYLSGNASSGTYYSAEGYWNELQALSTTCPGNTVLTWAGLGGWIPSGSHYLGQDGTAVNVSGVGQHQAWYEIVPKNGAIVPVNLYAHAGYGFVALTFYHSQGYYEFYMYDYYSGQGTDFTVTTGDYDGMTADFIVERGQSGSGYTPLTNFSYLTYKDAWVNGNSSGNGVGYYNPNNILMWAQPNGGGDLLAQPTGLTNNLLFTVTWENCS
jgi:hypothetical protein